MLREVQDTPLKYKDWIVDEGKLYRYREDPLLDPIVSHEEKLIIIIINLFGLKFQKILQSSQNNSFTIFLLHIST